MGYPVSCQCSAEAAFLRHCPTNFENDAAKTGPAGHLAHTDFGLAQDFESLWEYGVFPCQK